MLATLDEERSLSRTTSDLDVTTSSMTLADVLVTAAADSHIAETHINTVVLTLLTLVPLYPSSII